MSIQKEVKRVIVTEYYDDGYGYSFRYVITVAKKGDEYYLEDVDGFTSEEEVEEELDECYSMLYEAVKSILTKPVVSKLLRPFKRFLPLRVRFYLGLDDDLIDGFIAYLICGRGAVLSEEREALFEEAYGKLYKMECRGKPIARKINHLIDEIIYLNAIKELLYYWGNADEEVLKSEFEKGIEWNW